MAKRMEFFVLDKSFKVVDIVDEFESVIWTERFSAYGDFEFYVRASIENIQRFPKGYYLFYPDSVSTMVIDQVKITSNLEDGDHLVVSGRSLESLLLRRVIPKKVTYKGDIQIAIQTILNENVIKPTEARRKIDNFVFEKNNDLPDTSSETDDGYEFDGDTVYDAVKTILDSKKYGFRLSLVTADRWIDTKMTFRIINGTDHSYEQDKNPYVIFSSNYGNLVSSDTTMDYRELYNAAYVGGSETRNDDGSTKRLVAYVPNEDGSIGWDYHETFYGGLSVQQNDDEGKPLPDSTVLNSLKSEGKKELKKVGSGITFDAEVSSTTGMVYNEDYTIGDIVQFENAYNMAYPAKITEYIRNWDTNGYSEYPTLETIVDSLTSIDDSSGLPIRDSTDNTLHSSVKMDN